MEIEDASSLRPLITKIVGEDNEYGHPHTEILE
jgi:beta-lactamase superfamily II metal-dependent hydrolase